MIRFTTAGESHGPALVTILEGIPAGLPLLAADVDAQLARRQQGYGRGRRMQIEQDAVEFLSGVRRGQTLGSPIAMLIRNRDWKNWEEIMDPAPRDGEDPAEPRKRAVTRPRPGHADLSGALKYDRDDARDILERASARETTARVAAGGGLPPPARRVRRSHRQPRRAPGRHRRPASRPDARRTSTRRPTPRRCGRSTPKPTPR